MPAYGAMAAGLSLIIAQWLFVAAAADWLRHVGDPTQKLGLRRSAGWFTLANLVALLFSIFGPWLAAGWAIVAPPVSDPLFHLANPVRSIVLDMLPFFVFSIVVATAALWAMNLRPPRPERVRRMSLALLISGQYVLAYLIVGLTIYATFSPSLGGYEQVVSHDSARPALARIDARIWFVDPAGRAVRSARADGSDGRVEWPGPVPPDAMSMWMVLSHELVWLASEHRESARLELESTTQLDLGRENDEIPFESSPSWTVVAWQVVFVCPDRLVIVDLPGGKVSEHLAAATTGPDTPRPPASVDEVAAALVVRPAELLPQDGLRLASFYRPGLTRDMTRWLRQEGELERDSWVRRHGQGRRLPEIPTRPEWQHELELQRLGERLIVARYGDRLIVLDPEAGWIAPLGIRAEMFVVVP